MKLLVTGATGNLGRKVVTELLKKIPANQLAVSVRNVEKANDFKAQGVDVRYGDFDKPATLMNTFAGIDRLLLISTAGEDEARIRQITNAIQAIKESEIQFVAYTSIVNATDSELFVAKAHKVAEEAILATGIPYSFLRNNWYLENEMLTIQSVMSGLPWFTSAKSGKTGWALQQDFAEAAATVLSSEGHDNTIYELSGELLTQEELAAILSQVLGKEVPVKQVSDEEYMEMLKKMGIPEAYIPMLVLTQQDTRKGSLAIASNDFKKVLGHPATPIEEAMASIVTQIKQSAH